MKLILFFAISCLALHSGKGAPRTAVYKFVKCNPEGDQANCVTLQSPKMVWTPDLPSKLPASTAKYLEVESVEGESPSREEEDYESSMISEEGESPVTALSEDGSGAYEGSAEWMSTFAENDVGSGDAATEEGTKSNRGRGDMKRMFPSRSLLDKAKPAESELREDHLLKM